MYCQIKRSSITNKYKNYGNRNEKPVERNNANGVDVCPLQRLHDERGIALRLGKHQAAGIAWQKGGRVLFQENRRHVKAGVRHADERQSTADKRREENGRQLPSVFRHRERRMAVF